MNKSELIGLVMSLGIISIAAIILFWCLGIFFANFIGAVMYYFLVYRKVDWRIADER